MYCWCSKRPGLAPGLLISSTFCLQIAYFCEWTCLDWNQGPLPYQSATQGFSPSSRGVAKCRNMAFLSRVGAFWTPRPIRHDTSRHRLIFGVLVYQMV